jgi:dimethylargininase
VNIQSAGGLLHLKSGMAYLGENTMLLDERLAEHPSFTHYKTLIVPPDESYAGNCLRFNEVVFVPAGFPKTKALIQKAGFNTVVLETSEYRKMDGGLSCLSVRW